MIGRALVVLFALTLVRAAAGHAPSEECPNFLVIVTDDHPHDALSCAGHPVLRTPHIDALAARGTRFTHGFVTTPICAASRASILAGRYERSHGYTFGQPPLSPELVRDTYPAQLRAAGYRTGMIGKLGVRVGKAERAAMFDEFAPGTYPYVRDAAKTGAGGHLTDRNVERALAFLRADDERPFCLSLWFQAPHAEDQNPDQYVWPTRFDGMYDDAPIARPSLSDPSFAAELPEFMQSALNRERWRWRFDDPAKHDRMVRGYYRMLTAVDDGIGRVVRALERYGLADDTVVVLIGDNGYFLGERGFAGKWTMHDRSTRVPFVVVDPRSDGGSRTSDAFALNIDIAPTILEMAGLAIPDAVQGRSLAPVLAGDESNPRDAVFTEHLWDFERIPRTEAVRTREWKYIRYLDHPEYEELYDLRSDPVEEHNLANDEKHRAIRDELRARCDVAGAAAR